MKTAKQFLALSVAFMLFGAIMCASSAFVGQKPCNPVKLPVTYENQIGRDITNDSVWNEGLLVRKFENKTEVYLITKYNQK